MNVAKWWKVIVPVSLLATAAWIFGGCGTTPLGPAAPAGGGNGSGGALSPPLVTVTPEGTVGFTTVDMERGARRSGTTVQTASAKIDGNKGGKLSCGRFTLNVPAGAFIGPATLTMTVADPNVLMCDLSISPAAANKFAVPVQLKVALSDLGIDPTTLTFYWYDTNTSTWVTLPSTADTKAYTLTTSLQHFSIYATGKAGW